MEAVLALVGGFVTRFLPSLFGWIGNYFKERKEAKEQARLVELQMKADELRAKLAAEGKILDSELQQQLMTIQASIDEMKASIEDRKNARAYGQQALSLMTETLKVGVQMGLPKWVLGIGWFMVLSVETLAASVQPGIAVVVMAVWATARFKATGALTIEDWMLVDSVVGFFLAGRVIKYAETRKCSTLAATR